MHPTAPTTLTSKIFGSSHLIYIYTQAYQTHGNRELKSCILYCDREIIRDTAKVVYKRAVISIAYTLQHIIHRAKV
jgi:hypothetical protein